MARMTIINKREIIITFVTFSRPFCNPMEQTKIPAITIMTIQKPITCGWLSMVLNCEATASESKPVNFPVAVR